MKNEEAPPEDLLGAINGAFENAPADDADLAEEAPPEAEETEETEETPPEGEEAEETEEEAPEEDAEEEEAEEEGEEDPEAEIDPATGKPKAKEKPFDIEKDKLPVGTLKRTVEAFERIRGVLKQEREETREKITQLETKYQSVSSKHNELLDTIEDAGLDAPRFNTLIVFSSLFNSPAFEDRQKAFKFLESEYNALAKELGEAPIGVHPLTGHDDLIAAVQGKTMDIKHAVEMAQTRNRQAARQAHEQRHGERLREQQVGAQARAAAQAELKTLSGELQKKDGLKEFQRKSSIVIKEMLDDIKALPPARWASAFRRAYNLVPTQAAPPKPKPKNQPLRGKTPAGGGGVKQPKSLKEAIFGAFDKNQG